MTRTMPVEEAASHLVDLVSHLRPGDEIELTARDRTVASIIPKPEPKPAPPRGFGACKGMLTILREDDEHLADFKDYM